LALWVASDFLSALTWAAIIAITTWPIYTRFAARIARGRAPALAALLFTLLTGPRSNGPVILTVHQRTQGSEGFPRWVTQLRPRAYRYRVGLHSCRSPANTSIAGGRPT
jgi:predicted PurR-regulated permease PerM